MTSEDEVRQSVTREGFDPDQIAATVYDNPPGEPYVAYRRFLLGGHTATAAYLLRLLDASIDAALARGASDAEIQRAPGKP